MFYLLVALLGCAETGSPDEDADADSDTDTDTDTDTDVDSDTDSDSDSDTGSDTYTGPGDCKRSEVCPSGAPNPGEECNVPGSQQCDYYPPGCQLGYSCDESCLWALVVEEPDGCGD